MSMAMSVAGPDTRRRSSLPQLNPSNSASSPMAIGYHLSDEERAMFIVASSKRRPSAHSFFQSGSSAPLSASYTSPLASSSGGLGPQGHIYNHVCRYGNPHVAAISPILTPFQWSSNPRQYIMTDIGPQPPNSQAPTLRSQSHPARHRPCPKIGSSCLLAAGGCGEHDGTLSCPPSSYSKKAMTSPQTASMTMHDSCGTHMRCSTATNLCTIPQDEVLPAMGVPLEPRFAHDEWDDEDE
ncbi:hypothetical protein BX616_004929 [Lobosporangium transversale]|uniref:Uncharacterized protein n=1 Tax=Lobosporangium transversale TaxID=64571 RepID=A0A1Y2GX01_9FUNG|nr:hypothetical protein BCR41DRAFT_393440 [Lobosporangium transversale]KAF9915977.1 hypothetical protein BX616_004929 [Lobosporangium transversale]ORZ26830.1 hypothetical protein BCR41DRAFT_393440 [Lobosporangium transversale]|eukprot:XP_021884593.1 hypothetical protein BCR41DRAFT_393440 [Lobosporangium transversale]